MLLKAILLLQLVAFLKSSEVDKFPSVEINEAGSKTTIKGTHNVGWKQEYYAFRGIPYAKAPIGDLRFKDPQPLDKLPAFIDARYDGHDCPSITATNASEDCLTLNIYTGNLSPNASLPVLFFIHPGGLYVLSGLSSFIGPEYLLSKPLIIVTFNYRLGTLGFLNLGTKEIPGNAGFKDQVQALRWVKKYIHNFGGNPEDITIMGYSAGGQSVTLHLVSPMSRGLFQKAIAMSGSLPAQTQLPVGEQLALARKQAEALNCTDLDLNEKANIVDCLQRFSGNEIASSLRQLFDFGHDNPIYLWLPVIEHDYGQERFLSEDYYASLKAGNFEIVPLLIGATDGEFCSSAAQLIKNSDSLKSFYAEFELCAPKIFMYVGKANEAAITAAIRQHYLGGSSVNSTDFVQLCNLFSDAIIRIGSERVAELVAKHTRVYGYTFAYRGEYTNLDYVAEKPRVEHMDDLMYLFRMAPHHFVQEDADAKIIELYTNFMYDFIKHGKLSATSANDETKYPAAFAYITSSIEYRKGSNFAEAEFWKQLI